MNLKRILSSPSSAGLAAAIAAFCVYLRTLAPTVDFIDAGELTTVACTLGIAHPTGYPLFTLLGWMFSRLPLAAEAVVRLNLMAAFFCAAGVFVFFHVVYIVLAQAVDAKTETQGARDDTSLFFLKLASAGAALLLAFSETYWSQAVAVEVYSLHLFLLAVVSLTFLRAILAGERQRGGRVSGARIHAGARWSLFAFCLGLAFTNHMTTILLAPAFITLYFSVSGWNRAAWRRIGLMVLPFLAGLSVYLYLPFRATGSPTMIWGNPVTAERFFWHVSGKQFRVWLFSSAGVAVKQFRYFLDTLPSEFAYVGLLLAAAGVIILWRAHRKLAIWSALLFAGCVAYSINYDIHDIDSYFLLSYFTMALWMGCALFAAARWLHAHITRRGAVIAAICTGISLVPLFYHFRNADESDNFLVEDYTSNVFASLRPNALILSTQWDFWVSASYYYQIVKGVRPDAVVVDKELLRRSWYFLQLEHRYPSLVRDSRPEVDAFLSELDKFEHDLPRETYLPIQSRYVGMIRSFIARSMVTRPVYVTLEIEPELTAGYQRVPEGLAYRLYPDTLFHPSDVPAFTYRPYARSGRLEDMVKQLYSRAFIARGEYYLVRGHDSEAAERAFQASLSYDPANPIAHRWLAGLRH